MNMNRPGETEFRDNFMRGNDKPHAIVMQSSTNSALYLFKTVPGILIRSFTNELYIVFSVNYIPNLAL